MYMMFQSCLVPFACNYVGSHQAVVVIVVVILFIYLFSNTSFEQSCQFYMHTSSLCIELAVEHVAMPCSLVDTYKSVITALCHHLLGQRVSCMEKKCYRCRQGRSTAIRQKGLRKQLLLIDVITSLGSLDRGSGWKNVTSRA